MKANIYFDANKYNVSFDNQKYKFYFDSTIEGITPSGTLTITSNGTYDVTNYASAEVLTGDATYQSKSVTPSESAQTVTPDSGYDGLSSVNVGAISSNYVGSGITRQTALTVNDKTVTAPSGYYPNSLSETITITTQTKTVTPREAGYIIVTPDNGYDGLSQVTVNPIPSNYIVPSGSLNITENGTYDVTNYAEAVVNTGSSIESGSFTPASNTKTFSVTVDANTTNFVFYATDFDDGVADAGWNVVGGVWFNGMGRFFMRYNQANSSYGSATVTLSGTTLTYTAAYNLRTEKTYNWYAW